MFKTLKIYKLINALYIGCENEYNTLIDDVFVTNTDNIIHISKNDETFSCSIKKIDTDIFSRNIYKVDFSTIGKVDSYIDIENTVDVSIKIYPNKVRTEKINVLQTTTFNSNRLENTLLDILNIILEYKKSKVFTTKELYEMSFK